MDNFFLWPKESSHSGVYIALAGFGALFILALVVEALRQRRVRLRQLSQVWQSMLDLLKEKELTPQEVEIVTEMVRRHAPGDPLRAVTMRPQFDRCVEAEMELVAAANDPARFAKEGVQLRDIRMKLSLDYIPLGQPILSTRELHAGLTLFLAHATQNPPRWMRTKVTEIDEAFFYVAVQDHEAVAQAGFAPGEEVRGRIWRDYDARYAFSTLFERMEEQPPLLVFRHTSTLTRVQSRAHFRVRMDQATMVGVLNAPVEGSDDYSDVKQRRVVTRLRGRLTSLSAGGLALIVQQPMPSHVLLRVGIELDATGPFDVEARIVAVTPISGGRHLVRGAFVEISDSSRDRIARYVHYRQQHVLAEQKAE